MYEDEDLGYEGNVGAPSQPAQAQPEMPHDPSRKTLDLVFVQDCTGSQGSYISSATRNIEEICAHIFHSGKLQQQEDLRVGLVAYRDHPPQDHTWVYKNFGFTSDISKVRQDLSSLYATGGGDGPEAVTAGLNQALTMDWRQHATKMVVLIADAPPHGIGEYGDGFDDGSPDGYDPLQIAREMASRGITLFFVACEPALSGYSYATDFFKAMTSITSGLMLPLTTADLLAHAIVASVLENLDMDRLINEVGQAVAQRILGANESVDDVAKDLHERLLLRNESTKRVVFESIYRESEDATHNVQVFMNASSIQEARPHLRKVRGTRFTEKYLQARLHGSYSSYPPSTPPRSTAVTAVAVSPPSSPPRGSPARKVVQDFGAFKAPSSMSVMGTAVQKSPFSLAGNKASFGAMRSSGGGGTSFDDDDDDDDEGSLRPAFDLREDSISLDQAKRIAMQSAWRGMRS